MNNSHLAIPTKQEILEYLSTEQSLEDRLFISPLLDISQIGDTSIDLRLGHRFLAQKPSRMGLLDIIELHNEDDGSLNQNYSESRVPLGQHFTLHPQSSVQIGTLEYLGIPRDLQGIITLRASLSNLPVIANAAQVHPGHRGIISLTLTSNTNYSIKLFPGMRIAELQLRHIDTPLPSYQASRYHYMTKPLPVELHKDADLEYLGPVSEPLIIGITSTIAAGRTTAITHLTERHGFAWFSLADTLKSEAIKRGVPTLRSNLQNFGNNMRELHGDAFLAVRLRASKKWQMNKNSFVIVDGFKNMAEVDEFRKQKRFTLIGIDAPDLERWRRIEARHRQGDPTSFEGFSEQDTMDRGLNTLTSHTQQVGRLINNANYTIHNNGTVDEFISNLDDIISKIIYSS